MKLALPILLAAGLAAQPAFAQSQTQIPAGGGATGQTGSTYGFSSGAPNGMRSEAGTDMEVAQLELQMPQPQTQGNVTYLCGGIGETEAAYMNQQASEYDLKLTFASQTGAYLADVDVDIRNPQGQPVLQTLCGGPILLVDLPRSGRYRVQADAAGFTQTRNVQVNANSGQRVASVVVTWPQSVVAEMEPAEEPAMATGGSGVETSGGSSVDMRDTTRSGVDDARRGQGGAGVQGVR